LSSWFLLLPASCHYFFFDFLPPFFEEA